MAKTTVDTDRDGREPGSTGGAAAPHDAGQRTAGKTNSVTPPSMPRPSSIEREEDAEGETYSRSGERSNGKSA